MAVLVEAISVIIRHDSIEKHFAGGWQAFLRQVPNSTFCSDPDLVRVGFMSSADVGAFTSVMESHGLVFLKNGQAVDFAVVNQHSGPTVPAPWLEFGKIVKFATSESVEMKISACWLLGKSSNEIALPSGWKYEKSMSANGTFMAGTEIDENIFKFLRWENGMNVYLDKRTGKEMFLASPDIAGETEEAIFTRLRNICSEVLDIDDKSQPLKAAEDLERLAPLFTRLQDELLPAVQQIAKQGGRVMAFAHFALGLTLRILDRREEAEQAFRNANELQPGTINTLRELVRCLGEQNKHRQALPFAQEAVTIAPNDAGAWGNLAMSLIQCGERQEARNAIQHAIELEPQNKLNRYILNNFERYFEKS